MPTSERRPTCGFVSLGELDHDLRERTCSEGGKPTPRLPVRILHVSPGRFDAGAIADQAGGWLGLLILDGLMVVEIEAGRGHAGWLVGENDLLRPWDMHEISLTSHAEWRVLRSARLALLDDEFARRAGGIPLAVGAMLARSSLTAHWLLAKSLIASCQLIEDRLMLLFALFGERWGRVTMDGVLVDLPLTHSLLATLCGARRPSITLAFGALQTESLLTRAARGGWLLRRVDAGLLDGRPSSWRSYAKALGLS